MTDEAAALVPYSIVYNTIEAHAQGYFPDMPSHIYHAQAAYSASGGKTMLRSMQHYLEEKRSRKTTAAKQLGSAIHLCALEPSRIDTAYCVAPELNLRTAYGKQAFAEFLEANEGKIILRPGDDERAKRAVDAVHRNPSAQRLLAGAQTEGSCFWENKRFRIPCKMRFDIRNLGMLADIKSTKDASPEAFGRDCADFHYPLQAAVYCEGHREVFGVEPLAFIFIAVETSPPYGVQCYETQISDLLAGRHYFYLSAARYKHAIAYDEWPGYDEGISKLRLPRHYKNINVI